MNTIIRGKARVAAILNGTVAYMVDDGDSTTVTAKRPSVLPTAIREVFEVGDMHYVAVPVGMYGETKVTLLSQMHYDVLRVSEALRAGAKFRTDDGNYIKSVRFNGWAELASGRTVMLHGGHFAAWASETMAA